MESFLEKLGIFGASAGIFIATMALIWFVNLRVTAQYSDKPRFQKYWHLILIGLILVGIVLATLLMPIGDEMRGQLLGFFGILASATIALSSTTLVGNAMAGLMLQWLRNWHVGDYIQVGEHFGRISVMDLLHVEIQTEDRDLTTLPNLYVVTNPVTVLRNSGTVLHVDVSLGYDISRKKVEAALIEAAERTEHVEKPFVQIVSLGDFSIVYRVSGLLTDISRLIETRRQLRANTVDALHDAGIEIVSPSYMSTRQLNPAARILPDHEVRQADTGAVASDGKSSPDEVVFDKAREAEQLDLLKRQYTEESQQLLAVEQELKDAGQGDDRRPLTLQKKKLEASLARIAKQIEEAEAHMNGG